MNNLIQKISQKIIELQYNINITKPIENINKSENKKDLIIISDKGKELLEKEQRLYNLSQQIKQKEYQMTDEILDKAAESIAKLFIN